MIHLILNHRILNIISVFLIMAVFVFLMYNSYPKHEKRMHLNHLNQINTKLIVMRYSLTDDILPVFSDSFDILNYDVSLNDFIAAIDYFNLKPFINKNGLFHDEKITYFEFKIIHEKVLNLTEEPKSTATPNNKQTLSEYFNS